MGNFGKKQRISSLSRSEFICNQEKNQQIELALKINSVDHNDHPILVAWSSASKFVPNTKKTFEFYTVSHSETKATLFVRDICVTFFG